MELTLWQKLEWPNWGFNESKETIGNAMVNLKICKPWIEKPQMNGEMKPD